MPLPLPLPLALTAPAFHRGPQTRVRRGYYSCNGMSDDVKRDAPERTDPTYLWGDLLQVGGG